MEELIKYLEKKIEGCDELGGMEKEKWAFIQCLKEARKQVLNLADVSKGEADSVCCKNCGKQLKPMYMCISCVGDEMRSKQTDC